MKINKKILSFSAMVLVLSLSVTGILMLSKSSSGVAKNVVDFGGIYAELAENVDHVKGTETYDVTDTAANYSFTFSYDPLKPGNSVKKEPFVVRAEADPSKAPAAYTAVKMEVSLDLGGGNMSGLLARLNDGATSSLTNFEEWEIYTLYEKILLVNRASYEDWSYFTGTTGGKLANNGSTYFYDGWYFYVNNNTLNSDQKLKGLGGPVYDSQTKPIFYNILVPDSLNKRELELFAALGCVNEKGLYEVSLSLTFTAYLAPVTDTAYSVLPYPMADYLAAFPQL